MTAALTCRDEGRRDLIRKKGSNGIDYVDVDGSHLCVHFITGIPSDFLVESDDERAAARKRIVIRGGRRVTNIRALNFDAHATDDTYDEDCLGIDLDREGDWSVYTLCFVELDEEGEPSDVPMKSLDPRYACTDFTFRLGCPAEVDCKTEEVCPIEETQPAINYLAKDYASFRRLILDRLSLLMPDWRERHVPDTGIAIVEVLAYAADYLSYYQDAVASEAYLDTARQRISVRRHARLVDYRMHDGCNARVFVFLEVSIDGALTLADVYFVTNLGSTTTAAVLKPEDVEAAPPGWLAFEPLSEHGTQELYTAHNEIRIYTWGDRECCIPKGATRATLVDEILEEEPPAEEYQQPAYAEVSDSRSPRRRAKKEDDYCPPPPPPPAPKRKLKLEAGDFLLFEELACAGTVDNTFDGHTPQPDVDRTHRHVVRLTKVTPSIDPLSDQAVLEVEWSREDAMPFMLCVSAVGGPPECDYVEPLAIARGNVLLCDHGRTLTEPLDPIPAEDIEEVCEGEDQASEIPNVVRRYRPSFRNAPQTFAQPLIYGAPANVLLQQDPRAAVAAATLASTGPHVHGETEDLLWTAVYDLLDSGADDAEFVAEIDDDGRTHARFGDGEAGRAVELGMAFTATYRIGNGRAGLIGPEAIGHAVFRRNPVSGLIARVRNPLPSMGAADPEPVAEVKMNAPSAFRQDLQRAITGADYAALARYVRFPVRNPRVQNAAGSLVWSGSWYEADVAVDPFSTATLDDALRGSIESSLARYRRMGHDLRVEGAQSVPLRLELDLCIKENYLRAHVLVAVREAILKLFQPDNVTFGEAVYVSRIVAAVMAVDGVNEVEVIRLERIAQRTIGPPLGAPSSTGVLRLGPNEIARLDHDPAQPENGFLTFGNVRGGR